MFGREPDTVISPGILDLAHRPDEWVGIDDMVELATVMAHALTVLLSGARG